ncbi:serine hydrolase domain-containing protein [Streptomyces sp. NPDC006512]|uniref:serine hydrolase domain-containing protein n=1 Tax=Streptomyces sp. NPDC006512 TaxID=3154307 RepID=UPI0033A128A2
MTGHPRLRTQRVRRPGALLLGLALLLGAVAGSLWSPAPPVLGGRTSGDATLAERVRVVVGDGRGYRGLAVAVVEHGTVRTAGLGDSGNTRAAVVDSSTVFEAGSLGKPMTGMLLADLADRGRISLTAPLRTLLPDSAGIGPGLADATLEDLATHRAGLDKLPPTSAMALRELRLRLFGHDPYRGLTEEDVVSSAESAAIGTPGRYSYSNTGMALAGLAAAHHTRQPYPQLLRQHLFSPLGMANTRIVTRADPLPPSAAQGRKATGPAADHWYASGYTPAGDIWTTSDDMGRFLRAVMEGSAPGARAAEPGYDAGPGGRIGLGWFTSATEGRRITWQNAATGGFTSYMGFDRERALGVVVLSNTDRPVDGIGQQLLGLAAAPQDGDGALVLLTVAGTAGASLPALAAAAGVGARRTFRGRRFLDAAFAMTALALTHRLGDWLAVPPVLWTAGLLLAAGAVVLDIARAAARATPAPDGPHPFPGPAVRAGAARAGLLAATLAALATSML